MTELHKTAFANKVYDILEKIGGAPSNQRHTFVYAHTNPEPCIEWRFQGKLGFGGKYRSRSNSVDFYKEDETPERIEIEKQINLELGKLPVKPILYIDMDGVVADFNLEIRKIHPTCFDLEDGDERGRIIDEICESDINIFSRLEPIEGAIEAINKLQESYEIYFLSTPMWNVPQSFTDKRLWIDKHFGELAKKRLILSHRKDLNYGAFLIDDRLKNGAGEFTGRHLHFGTADFPDWNSILKHLLN